jgi:hypothetical protein
MNRGLDIGKDGVEGFRGWGGGGGMAARCSWISRRVGLDDCVRESVRSFRSVVVFERVESRYC